MKLTNAQLKQIIKEELSKVLNEQDGDLEQLETSLKGMGFNVVNNRTSLMTDNIEIESTPEGFNIIDLDYPDQSREISKSVEKAIEDIKDIVRHRGAN